MKSITAEEVKKIANLARLKVTDQEVEKFTGQLASIFGYINQLQEVDTKNIQPIKQISGLVNVVREDVVNQYEPQAGLVDCAPEKEGGYVKTKNVL